MNEIQWKLTLVLDEATKPNRYPTKDLAQYLESTVDGPGTWDDWERHKPPFVAVGGIQKIEAWLEHIHENTSVIRRTLCIEKDSIPAVSYFAEKQLVARQALLNDDKDTPPLTLLSKLLDHKGFSTLAIASCSLRCQYWQGKWRLKFESTSYPKVVSLLQSNVGDELSLNAPSTKNEFHFELDLGIWVEPGKILIEVGSSRYYVDQRKTQRNPNSFGTEANTSCQKITEHPDYREAIPPDSTLIDATLATLVTGSLLLLPAMILWLNRFNERRPQEIPTDPPTIRKLIDYLLKPEFDSEAAIELLQAFRLPIDASNFDGERFAIREDWVTDQRVAFQLIIPESRIESVFKLDHSRLDSRAVLA